MPAGQTTQRELWAWTALIATILFVLDMLTPTCVNFEVLFIGLVFVSLWSTRRSFVFVVAVCSTCFVLQGAFRAAIESGNLGLEIVNHLLVVAVIWAAALLCQLREQAVATETRLLAERKIAEKENEELTKSADDLRERNEQLAATRDVAVLTLAKVAESRDLGTGRHLERICAYSLLLASELRKDPSFRGVIDQEFMTNLRQSSPLHDIGKVSIRDSILLKPGRLTTDEYNEMKCHASVGSDILQDVVARRNEATFLKMAIIVARYHHERFDGRGYPEGLSGKAIPLAARIVALADVYDALTSERPYKNAYSPEMARKMIVTQSGLQFDPEVVQAFLRRFDDFVSVGKRYPAEQPPADTSMVESLLAEYHDVEEQWDRESTFLNDFIMLLKMPSAAADASCR
jgi:response regulator RpfG family c-di-GMP phosphodiesterase